ncbi:keratin, type I cytoskeletal 9-like isoform X3 [Penaeus japonicus]|uniref:keratin, type I cytoskeletal 9-like isoform X1 n=1 Tax=Penaeus japonicus TaxID=27405 RepID=UPI001C70BD9A|nr:keratin, type I cytoskeletal 9-like isoform X1 [Penaeus japonicus]XP_042881606.1 keratin, type I cytoskeletal 9-like isoform X3 [Penaeus japonicus]
MATKTSSHLLLAACFCLALMAQQGASHGYGYGRWGHRRSGYLKPSASYGGYGSSYGSRGGSYGGHGGSYGSRGSYGSHGSHGNHGSHSSYGSHGNHGSYGNRGGGYTSYGQLLGRPVTVSAGTPNNIRPPSHIHGSGVGVQGVNTGAPVPGIGVGVQGVNTGAPVQGSGEVSHIHLVDENAGGPVGPTFISSGGSSGAIDPIGGGTSGIGVDISRVDLRNNQRGGK